MKISALGYLPCLLVALGLATLAFVFQREISSYRLNVEKWAERDLVARTQLAAENIRASLATGDMASLQTFSHSRTIEGLRLTVLSSPGGMIFDSETNASGNHANRPEVQDALDKGEGSAIRTSTTTGTKMLFCARREGDFIVRLALPYETVVEPWRRNRPALICSGLIGAAGILFIFLFMVRLTMRNRSLARERDAKALRVAELQRLADYRRDFVANLSHEIKTPLTGILGVVEVLTGTGADEMSATDRATLLEMLKRESVRLDGLARDVLSLSRLEQEEVTGHHRFERCNLADILRVAIDRVQPQAQANNIKIDVLDMARLEMACDATLIEQALVNLMMNAIRHAQTPDIVVRLQVLPEGGAAFIVQDHGVGIAPQDCTRLFERFYRVDSSRVQDKGGSGLGLAIVKHIAKIHGGDVTVTSTLGEGSTFTLVIKQNNP